ncbi:winged helix-turn-helix transcriptional regulator [Neorhizobium sp. DAR64872/K0K18]|uniref:winged helix-turn-helix transcriptional regulator n=1 Tax=Neorhizobium sp. DAR64872/K0K18 TaxID=3421958 RepID=UPI003D28AC0C
MRDVEASVPPSVTYELTQLGQPFAGQVAALVEWSRDSKHQIELAQESFDARQGA